MGKSTSWPRQSKCLLKYIFVATIYFLMCLLVVIMAVNTPFQLLLCFSKQAFSFSLERTTRKYVTEDLQWQSLTKDGPLSLAMTKKQRSTAWVWTAWRCLHYLKHPRLPPKSQKSADLRTNHSILTPSGKPNYIINISIDQKMVQK